MPTISVTIKHTTKKTVSYNHIHKDTKILNQETLSFQ